jgi:Uncharacterized protein conserved in bacteria (DUF2252)
MAASFTIAGRNNSFAKADTKAATLASVAAYREAMASFAQMRTMDIWYARMDEDKVMAAARSARVGASTTKEAKKKAKKEAKQAEKSLRKEAAKARTRDSLQALSKLGELVDGRYRIVSQPPIVVPVRELEGTYGLSREEIERGLREQFRAYRATLRDDQRQLLERFQLVDVARKVVGVGSVGTRAFIALLQGRDQQDPLFLQVKEATASVLEDHLPKSRYRQHGERVVQGQRMMQAASDIFLGWTKGADVTRHFYWRQLRDMKGSADVEAMAPVALNFYAGMCGWTLARAPCPFGRPRRDRRLPGRERRVRPVDQGLRRALRRPERARLPGFHRGNPIWTTGSPRRHLRAIPATLARHALPTVASWPATKTATRGSDGHTRGVRPSRVLASGAAVTGSASEAASGSAAIKTHATRPGGGHERAG